MVTAPAPPGVFSNRKATIKRVVSANPAAGAEFTLTVPAGRFWDVKSVSALLVQGITDTPRPMLQVLDDSSNIIAEYYGSSAAQAVSTSCLYTWAGGADLTSQAGATTDVHSTGTLPPGLILPAGWALKSKTIGIAATGDWGIASAMVTEYL